MPGFFSMLEMRMRILDSIRPHHPIWSSSNPNSTLSIPTSGRVSHLVGRRALKDEEVAIFGEEVGGV